MQHILSVHRHRILTWAIIAGAVSIAIVIVLWQNPSTTLLSFKVLDVINPIMNLVAAIFLFRAGVKERAESHSTYGAFFIFSLALFCTFLGDIAWGSTQSNDVNFEQTNLLYGLFILYYPLILIGVLHLPAIRLRKMDQIRKVLEIIVNLLALILIYWNFLLAPAWDQMTGDFRAETIMQIFYPVSGLMLLFGAMLLGERLTHKVSALFVFIMSASLIVMIITDGLFSWHLLNRTYQSGSGLQIGWLISSYLALVAAYTQLMRKDRHSVLWISQRKIERFVRDFRGKVGYTQYIYLIGVFVLLVRSHYFPMKVGFVPFAIGLGIILILVIIQQILNTLENQNLNDELLDALQTIKVRQDELLRLNRSLEDEIIERKSLEMQLKYDVLHDPLTGLPNRVLFMDRLGQALELMHRHPDTGYAVLFLDLDQFKPVNDELGHDCGDQLLIEVARRLSASLRTTDTVARLGGDEFVFLLEDMSRELIPGIVKRIQEELAPPLTLMGRSFQITASIGVVACLQKYTNPEQVLRDADKAMYRAKALGKDGHILFCEMDKQGSCSSG